MDASRKIALVVDDEALIEQYIQEILAKHGYASQSFTDPVKALDSSVTPMKRSTLS